MALTKQQILDEFKHKDIKFYTDDFEELYLKDLTQGNEQLMLKLNRNLTAMFKKWLSDKLKAKENIAISIMGGTRSGKSLIGLRIASHITEHYKDKSFEISKIVCGNQKEFRQSLFKADFGDTKLVDENAFSKVGMGSMSESQQLTDIQNIIAKQNIHTIYITPKKFLDNNASYGLKSFGRDNQNWLSRFLLYTLKNGMGTLMGYIILDVGSMFSDYGCLIYREIGGCNNTKKLTPSDITKEKIEHSSCIPKDKDLGKTSNTCPFYNICTHPLCAYEHKKDSWIEVEMKGGMDSRLQNRIIASIQIIPFIANRTEDRIMFKAKNKTELKIKVNMEMFNVTSTKFTGDEQKEIITIIESLTNLDNYKNYCKKVNLEWKKEYAKIPTFIPPKQIDTKKKKKGEK